MDELRARYTGGVLDMMDHHEKQLEVDECDTPVMHNYADVNNESLGFVTGSMVKAELEKELGKLEDMGYRVEEGKRGKECSIC